MKILARVDPSVRRLRARALVHTLCDLAGCPKTGYSLGLWWARQHRVVTDQLNRKWDTYFKGSTPRPYLLEQMFADFPALSGLVHNPLWLALSDSSGRVQDWDLLIDSLRIGGQPLGGFHSSATSLLFSRADWPCFGLMIMLLRTRSPRFLLHRKWLRLNLSTLCSLVCIQTPLSEVRLGIYAVLSNLLSQEPFAIDPVRHWPSNIEWFEEDLAGLDFFLNRIQSLGWLNGSDAQCALLLWILLDRDDGLAVLGDVGECHACKWPGAIKRVWGRNKKQWDASPITLGDYRFPDPA